jgi:outer membrane protein assembly factor BamB
VRSRLLPLAVPPTLAACLLAGCTPAAPAESAASSTAAGHGAVSGASEVAEPPLALVTVDPQGGVHQLDLLDESVSRLGEVAPPARVSSDGRYVFVDSGAGVEVVDSGRWTWDHVDHFHYYLAEQRMTGAMAGSGSATVATTTSSTTGGTGVFFAPTGDAVLLDTEALSRGEIVERYRRAAAPHDGMIVPVGAQAILTQASADGEVTDVRVLAADGAPTDDVAACPAARGTIATRVGAVVGCSDGAVLATSSPDGVVLERIPLPEGAPAPAPAAFAGRDGRPTVAGLAGEQGIWLLDTRERTWTLLPAPAPLVRVTAVDDAEQTVLALSADGRVLVLDGETGAQRAATEPLVAASLADPSLAAGVSVIADAQRAYLNAPAERRLYEIDFADGGRIARAFDTDHVPAFVAEVGR